MRRHSGKCRRAGLLAKLGIGINVAAEDFFQAAE
jgi:hypothetical protein